VDEDPETAGLRSGTDGSMIIATTPKLVPIESDLSTACLINRDAPPEQANMLFAGSDGVCTH